MRSYHSAWITQLVRNEVQRTLLIRAPERWPDERLDEIEWEVMRDTRERLDGLTDEELSSKATLGRETWIAVSDTKDLIFKRRMRPLTTTS
jgi:hypothetical protein